MFRFVTPTYVGKTAAYFAGVRLFPDQRLQAEREAQPRLFEELQGNVPVHGMPWDALLDTFPSVPRLLQRFSSVPPEWDQARFFCRDQVAQGEVPALSSLVRHAGKRAVKLQFLPFVGDPLSAIQVRQTCEFFQREPLSALDALAFGMAYAAAPRPFCAVGSTFILEDERFILSCEEDENRLPILIFRREGYLPRECLIPVYMP